MAATFAAGMVMLCGSALGLEHEGLLENYCFDCHDDETKKGDLDLVELLDKGEFDGSLMFENLITGKMPPADKEQPSAEERQALLSWLAERQVESAPNSFRRISRHEFVHSVNDLLGTDLDLAGTIPRTAAPTTSIPTAGSS